MPDVNVFKRYAYSPRYNYDQAQHYTEQAQDNNLVVFSGGDLQAYINNIKVGNLESVTWSISVEVVGNYVMGRRDAVVYTTGKRVVVGSIVLSQYDRHALLEQVFKLSKRGLPTLGHLWASDLFGKNNVGQALSQTNFVVRTPSGVNPTNSIQLDATKSIVQNFGDMAASRGLSRDDFERQLREQLTETARMIGATKFNYSDQLPPFDLTLVGVTKSGDAARCSIFGMQITQETTGFSQNDLGNSVGMSFVALAVSPWREISPGDTGGTVITAPLAP